VPASDLFIDQICHDTPPQEVGLTNVTFDLPNSLLAELNARSNAGQGSVSSLVTEAIAAYLDTPLHTLFQVSTSRSLVAGKYGGVITCAKLLEHGDFGLGTFAGLNGEMIVLDGHIFRIEGSGRISEAHPDDEAPFATVTRFAPTIDELLEATVSFDDLKSHLDKFRRSDNLFYAIRIDGTFTYIKTRAVCPPKPGATLLDAAKAQHEFEFTGGSGTLIGIYSPSFSGAVSVPGYHLHYLSDDRTQGGHLLQIRTENVRLRVQELEDFHVALPETEEFLRADLRHDTSSDLDKAESGS
jgi:acetolactate decarboxylase